MFSLTVFCEDKKLHKLLWLLDGAIVGEPLIRPVRGAVVKGGQIKEADEVKPIKYATPYIASIAKNLAAYKGARWVSRADLETVIEASGGNTKSIAYVVKTLKALKVLKGGGSGTRGYTVL